MSADDFFRGSSLSDPADLLQYLEPLDKDSVHVFSERALHSLEIGGVDC